MRKTQTIQKVPWLAPEVATKVIPAPTDGWDAISPLASMDPKRAAILTNFVPRPGYVEIRGGSIVYSGTGDTDPVETLMVYRSATGEEMFAAVDTTIVDVTNPGLYSTVVSGLTSARWQYINYNAPGAARVIQCVNGADSMHQYNGTTWSTPTISIASVAQDTSAFINIWSHKRRIWYILKDSSTVWFMPTDATSGDIAGTLDFGALWDKGGYLVAMGTWTIDGGIGPDDYAVFISSRGQITVYKGTDPTDADNWSLVGVFEIAPPIGRRCVLRVGSDLAVITQQGVIPISQALPFDPSSDRSVTITARIQNAMVSAAQTARDHFGWQIITFPAQQLALLNVPYTESTEQTQFVMSVLTGAWCKFTGWNANCFEIFNDNLYFGGNDGIVYQGYAGSSDTANAIAADMQCAFNWMDDPGKVKRMTMIQPLIISSGDLTPTIAVDVDFTTSTDAAPISTIGGTVLWDTAVWDVDVWPSPTQAYTDFLSVSALGRALAVRMKVNLNTYNNDDTLGIFDLGVFDQAEFDQGYSSTLPVLQINAFNTISESGGSI